VFLKLEGHFLFTCSDTFAVGMMHHYHLYHYLVNKDFG